MTTLGEFCFDVATGLSLGARERQEDAVVADFPRGAPMGFAVLSDGMGGHASGDVASGIVATELFSELKLLSSAPAQMEQVIGAALQEAVTEANRCIALYEGQHPSAQGMGATLVAPVLFENRLYWVSVGDSPLYLFRQGKLFRLNEDHSYAAQIDRLHAQGIIPLEEARNHPDRSALVSVLAGGEIAKIDCRAEAMSLKHGDIVLAASDGLHSLSDDAVAEVLQDQHHNSGGQICDALLQAVAAQKCPEQDNLSLCVIKVDCMGANQNASKPAPVVSRNDTPVLETGQVVHIDRNTHQGVVRTVVSLTRKARK